MMTKGITIPVAALIAGLAFVRPVSAQDTVNAETVHYAQGSDQDPRVRYAMFLQGEQHYFSAATTLLSIESATQGQRLPPSFYHHLADATLAFGLPGPAEHSYREAAPSAPDPLKLGKSQLELAEGLYAHGRYQDTSQLLQAIRPSLPDNLFTQWQSLAARNDLALDRTQDAIDVTVKPDNEDDQSPYQNYNLAVAMLRAGRTKDGLTELNLVGRMSPVDSDTLALRDKANLLLGYHYLRAKQGDTALKLFERIRLKGPYSNRALLGMGWARLTQKGKPSDADTSDQPAVESYPSLSSIGALIRPGFLDNAIERNARVKQLRRLELPNVTPGKESALRAALVPWSVLLSRDPMDPAVQECMLAVPYVLDQIGAHIQAREFYQKAIDALQQTRQRLDDAKRDIRSNRMVDTMIKRDEDAESGWQWRLTDLPDAVETFYLQHLIADHPFQDSIKNLRDLKLLQRRLDSLDSEMAQLQSNRADDANTSVPLEYLADQARLGISSVHDAHNESANGAASPGVLLRMSDQLTTGSLSADSPDTGKAMSPELALAPAPAHFEGAWEHVASLRKEIDSLRPRVKQAIIKVNERLQDMALQDLDQQDKVATRYLAEARFALARLYDSGGPDNGDSP